VARDLDTEVVVVPRMEWADAAARRIAAGLHAGVAARGKATILLAGGNTPRPAYAQLAELFPRLPWDRIDVFFGDERAVPPDHPGANYRMAAETLLDPARVPDERRHRMPAERPDREAAAHEYAELLPERPDLVLLGIGADCHIASLFPGASALHEQERRVVSVQSPRPPTWRLTVTPPVIAAARERIVLANGRDKAAAVARALFGSEDASACPARLARAGVWILDSEAAPPPAS
jgi:6-phosphogluconolactonase